MKKKQAAEKPDRHKKKGKTKPGLTFVERRRLAELKHMLAGTNKNAEKPTTAQKTITFQKMYRDGICQVTSGFYTKMVEFYDINYDLLEIEDRGKYWRNTAGLSIILTRLLNLSCSCSTDRLTSRP